MSYWSQEREDTLKKLWAEGHSAQQISNRMPGSTRGSIMGKVRRLGLEQRKTRWAPRGPRRNKPKTISAVEGVAKEKNHARHAGLAVQATNYANREQYSEARGNLTPLALNQTIPKPDDLIELMELTEATCRWPYGDVSDDDFGFCGALTTPGRPYCEGHCSVAYSRPKQQGRIY